MTTNHNDVQHYQGTDEAALDVGVDKSYRSAIRSNILKRIYDKSSKLSSTANIIEDAVANGHQNEKKDLVEISRTKLNPLGNEWRKTLERILNYDQKYWDGQLEVNRKDALAFFVQKEWPQDDGQKRRKPKKTSPDRESAIELFVERKPKLAFKELTDTANTSSIVTLQRIKDSEAIEATSGNILHGESLYERFILKASSSLDSLHEHSYLFKRNLASKALRFFAWIYDFWFAQQNYTTNQIAFSKTTKSNQLNNNRFVLDISQLQVSLFKHHLMEEEHKTLGLLRSAFESYEKSISATSHKFLIKLDEIIDNVTNKIDNPENDKTELESDLNLLRRLIEKKREIVTTRRKTLIELLKVWDRVVSNKSTNKYVTSGAINLVLDEATSVNEELERAEWNEIIERNCKLIKLISPEFNPELDIEQIKSTTFLQDGRLPGEPKFNHVELIFDTRKQNIQTNKNQHLDIAYYIQISIGTRKICQFDSLNVDSDFGALSWINSKSVTFPPAPFELNASTLTYSQPLLASASHEDLSHSPDYADQLLPMISIYEKSTRKNQQQAIFAAHEPKLIFQQTITNMPNLNCRSMEKSKLVDFDFEFKDEKEEKDKRRRLKGNLRFNLFWSSIPFDAKSQVTSSNSELMFDSEKRTIKGLNDLNVINQMLHDLRFLDSTDLDNILDEQLENAMRRIELMDLLLKQKYQIELNQSLVAKKKEEPVLSKQEIKHLPDGDFCTDDYIEQNKRFQLMIYRNLGTNRNYRQLRFIPLNNVTAVMLKNMMLNEKAEKISIELLMDFFIKSCEDQEKRLKNLDNNKRKKKKRKNENASNRVFHDWCLISSKGQDNARLLMSANHCIQTLGQVFDKLELEQQQHQSGDYFNRRILSISDIVREEQMEAFDASDFSLFTPFVGWNRRKLNPSRKDRRKVAITLAEAIDREVQAVLSVQHAFNVPLSIRQLDAVEDEDDEDELDRYNQCSTFVEIKHNNESIVSTIAEGSQPTWNESFRLKLKLDPRSYITLELFEVVRPIRSNSLSSDRTTPTPERHEKSATLGNQTTEDRDSLRQEMSENRPYLHSEKRYFGQIRIPIFAILFNSKIEGTFSLSSPYFLYGYRSLLSSTSQSAKRSKMKLMEQSEESAIGARPEAKLISTVTQMQSLYSSDADQTLLGCLPDIGLSIFLTIDPPIEPIIGTQFSQKSTSLESDELVDLCNRWQTQLSSQFHHRHFISLVENVQHKLVLACRFISAIKPPELNELIQLDQILAPTKPKSKDDMKRPKSIKKLVHKEALHLNMIIRYVSLIPSYYSNPPLASVDQQSWWLRSTGGVWMDAIQFLSVRIGFQVEHALYLCCMLHHLDRDAFLVYGTSCLEGPTGQVILYPSSSTLTASKDSNLVEYEPIIIDPKTGQQFSVRDYNITIHSIDCIVTNENIYANIQKNSHPNSMQYNLAKSSHWNQLFTAKDLARFSTASDSQQEKNNLKSIELSIQPEFIDYSNSISQDSVQSFESKLENYLRDQLMNWRRQQFATYTPFNRFCTQIVRRLLPQLETHASLASTIGTVYNQAQQAMAIEEAILQDLDEISATHRLVGYPLHVSPLIDFDQIAKTLHSTGLHLIDLGLNSGDSNMPNTKSAQMTEFILSVYVHPYPANVYSIWVYFGALLPKT